MRQHQKAILVLLAVANLAVLGTAAMAARTPGIIPLPARLLAATLPTAVPIRGPERVLPTPPVIRYQPPAPNAAPPTTTAAPAVIELQPTVPSPQATVPSLKLPEEAFVEGVVGHRQSLPLSCESRSAADWAAFFGVAVDELTFLSQLPASDDPDRGFVGDVRGRWGQTPPNPYGVHAGPVARLLAEYGLRAKPQWHMKWEALQAEIAAGQPVIVWVVGHVETGESQMYTAADGRRTVVAPFEHTVIVVGYTAEQVTVVDGASVRTFPVEQFLASWAVLRNMAVSADV